jgi:hypothetical protein
MMSLAATEFRYERGTQSLPKVGPWREQLEALLLANEQKALRERLTLIRIFEDLRLSWLSGKPRRGSTLRPGLTAGMRGGDGGSLCAAELCARRGVSV